MITHIKRKHKDEELHNAKIKIELNMIACGTELLLLEVSRGRCHGNSRVTGKRSHARDDPHLDGLAFSSHNNNGRFFELIVWRKSFLRL